MKWILIVTIIFNDGDKFTGPLTADVYSEQQCKIVKKHIDEIVDGRFKVVAAECVSSEAI